MLGRQIFGEYAMIQSTVMAVTAVAQLAMGYTATKYVAEFRSTDPDRTGRILGLCELVATVSACLAALGVMAAAPWLAAHVLRAPHLTFALGLMAVVVLFAVMNGYQVGALAGLESYRAIAIAGVTGGVVSIALCSSAAWWGGFHWILGGLVASAAAQWFVTQRLLARETAEHKIFVHWRGALREISALTHFALPATLSGLSTLPALWLAQLFLVRQPGGYEQMALYGAASTFRMLVLFLPYVISNVGASLLNHQRGVLDAVGFRRMFRVNIGLTAWTVTAGTLVVVLLGRWLLLVFGRTFDDANPVLVLLMLGTVFEGLAIAAYLIIHSEGKMWLSLFGIVLPRDLSIVSLSYLLSPAYGARGLAVAQSAGSLVALTMCVYLAKRVHADMRLGAPARRVGPSCGGTF